MSIIGLFAVRAKEGGNLHNALNMGTYVAAVLQVAAMGFLFWHWSTRAGSDPARMWFFAAVLAGLAAGIAIGKITEYFCSDHFRPVKKIAEASETGAATNIIAGLGTGMMSTALPIFVVSAGIIASYSATVWQPIPAVRHLRHRSRGARHALDHRHHGRCGRLRPGCRQRRRHR
jgi:K(+)-stimulated pyrophosphate-energized sodium pump